MHARLFALLAASLPAVPAAAQTLVSAVPDDVAPRGTLAFTIENDLFGNTDRYFTNGVRFGYTSPVGVQPAPVAWLDRQLGWLLGPGEARWGVSLGQWIYTPANIRLDNPDPRDRPYAGLLEAALTLERATERQRTVFEVQVGWAGPGALGEEVQNGFHDLIRHYRANGWDHQIGDEPVLGLLAERRWRLPLSGNA